MKKIILSFFLFSFLYLPAQKPYKIIAYYTGNGESIKQWPVHKLTHIIYSFLRIRNDSLGFHHEKQENSLQQIVALKKIYPTLKVMVSIGGWGGCSFCSDMFSSAARRKIFIETTLSLFRKYGIDGLDLDWEYPAIEGYPGHVYTPEDKNNFTLLVKEMRQKMGDKFMLTFAAGGFVQYLEASIDWEAVIPLVDFVNLMTYDLVGGYATVTGHHTPLNDYRPAQESTDKCVKWLLKNNVPPTKLIIGAAMYARVWKNVPDTNQGLYQPGIFHQGVSYADFNKYFKDTSGFKLYWDKKANAPYAYNKRKKLFATMDDKQSIKSKTDYIRTKKLGGIMFWELLQDKHRDGLVDEMYKGLNK